MRRALVRGAELQFDFHGVGQPILLIHGTVLADAMFPLAQQSALTQRHLVIRHHRRGYGGSSRLEQPWSVEQHALDALKLLDHLGIGRVHVVGHSAGAAVALEMALDFPERIGALVLMELGVDAAPSAGLMQTQIAHAHEKYERGENAAAIDELLSALSGPDYRRIAETTLGPTPILTAVRDSDAIFLRELPALSMWGISQTVASRLSPPTLIVTGASTPPVYKESHALLREWFSDTLTESAVIAGAGHALHMTSPAQVATVTAQFLRRNSIGISASA
jgi:pimeloyl-ACP methyl ester carboxylesterase